MRLFSVLTFWTVIKSHGMSGWLYPVLIAWYRYWYCQWCDRTVRQTRSRLLPDADHRRSAASAIFQRVEKCTLCIMRKFNLGGHMPTQYTPSYAYVYIFSNSVRNWLTKSSPIILNPFLLSAYILEKYVPDKVDHRSLIREPWPIWPIADLTNDPVTQRFRLMNRFKGNYSR